MQLELNQLIVPPGHQLLLKDVSWQMFENILVVLVDNIYSLSIL